MKYTIYRCDYCEQVLSDEVLGVFKPHISINIGDSSGFYVKDPQDVNGKFNDGWERQGAFPKGIYQYCDKYCLTEGLIEQKKISILPLDCTIK